MSKKGFDQVWDYLPHFSFYQLGLTCGISTMAVNCGLWVLWSVFGFYRPGRYRCSNVLDQQDMVSEHFLKISWKSRDKVERISPMVINSILPHAEVNCNNHREVAHHNRLLEPQKLIVRCLAPWISQKRKISSRTLMILHVNSTTSMDQNWRLAFHLLRITLSQHVFKNWNQKKI